MQQAALPQPFLWGFQARPAPLLIPAWAPLTRGQDRPSPAKPSSVQARAAPRRPWWTRGHCLFLCPGHRLRAGSTFGQPQNPVWMPLSSFAQHGDPAGVQGCSQPHRLCPFSVFRLPGAMLAGALVPSSHWDPCCPPISCLEGVARAAPAWAGPLNAMRPCGGLRVGCGALEPGRGPACLQARA